MKKETRIKELSKMFYELTDPVKREEARRRNQINKNLSDKKSDTGIC